jgi:hypothetical protein
MNSIGKLSRLEWFALLGEMWIMCDNIWRWRSLLKELLQDASRDQLDAMMDAAEREALAKLPAQITVYRGCYKINRSGLSWTLDRAIAERFPTIIRYWRSDDQPLLLTGTVSRERVVLTHGRGEQEIIAPKVKIISTELLPKKIY